MWLSVSRLAVSAEVHRDLCLGVLLRRAGGAYFLRRRRLGRGRGRHHRGQL